MISAALAELIQIAIAAHNNAHPGEFLDCREEDCEDLHMEFVNLIDVEMTLEACRAAEVAA